LGSSLTLIEYLANFSCCSVLLYRKKVTMQTFVHA
jgi:hypothetical protein